jgi:hypothetical protein
MDTRGRPCLRKNLRLPNVKLDGAHVNNLTCRLILWGERFLQNYSHFQIKLLNIKNIANDGSPRDADGMGIALWSTEFELHPGDLDGVRTGKYRPRSGSSGI